jgi:hypothetical protein
VYLATISAVGHDFYLPKGGYLSQSGIETATFRLVAQLPEPTASPRAAVVRDKRLRAEIFSERLGKIMRWRRDVRVFNRRAVYVVLKLYCW